MLEMCARVARPLVGFGLLVWRGHPRRARCPRHKAVL